MIGANAALVDANRRALKEGKSSYVLLCADAEEESQAVVDEFFQQANLIAEAGRDVKERKQKLEIYKDRRKAEASDGVVNGINNW